MTTIDAEARAVPCEHEWSEWRYPPGEETFRDTWGTRICWRCGGRQFGRVSGSDIIATPDTAIWHEDNDWDEQED